MTAWPRAADTGGGEHKILVGFTEDMVETLLRFFGAYQRDGVVTLQLTEGGWLWLVNPHDDTRQFLGRAVLSEAEEHERQQRAGKGPKREVN